MARTLTISRTIVPLGDRNGYFEKLAVRKSHYEGAKCRFWVFEEVSLPGAFIEFTEANDATILSAAHANAPHRILDAARIYQEVEL